MTARIYLAAVNAPDWLALGPRLDKALASGFAGVDVRLANVAHPSTAERELAKRVIAAGLTLRCHSWVGHRAGDSAAVDAASGRRDGDLAAAACSSLGAASFGANAERDVWRGQNGTAHPKAVDYLNEHAETFLTAHRTRAAVLRGEAKTAADAGLTARAKALESEARYLASIEIDYVGFAVPAWHYKPADSDHDGDIDTEIPEYQRIIYSRIGVMAYQSTEAAIRATVARGERRWPEHTEARRIVPWLGVGRLEAGEPVGSAAAARVFCREYAEIVFYVGFGAIGQVLDGHPKHESLASIARDLSQPRGVA